jgi:undecaprenyl-diphosphatase
MNKTEERLRIFKYSMIIWMGISISAILIFTKLAEDLAGIKLNNLDFPITKNILGLRTPIITKTMKLITSVGSAETIIFVLFLVIYVLYRLKKNIWYSFMVMTSALGGLLLEAALKWAFQRPRPNVSHLVGASGYSFPSGHATIAVAFYGFLAYLLWLYFHKTKLRYLTTVSLVIIIILIGISRIYLGVHYPSDVLAGFAVGWFWLAINVMITENIRLKKAEQQDN